jgi:hypothetical protein
VTTVSFEVPRVPMTINRLSREHWRKRVEEKHTWMLELRAAMNPGRKHQELRAWAECGDKVRVEIHVVHGKEFDPDNLYSAAKIPLDALKGIGCLMDDTGRHVELKVSQEIGKPKMTKFRITRLEL